MKLISRNLVIVFISIGSCLLACVTSRVKPIDQVSSGPVADSSSVKIFLLERDIPQDIEQMGVVAISIESSPSLTIDEQVKRQLRKDCQRAGANGAYRINDGTYYPQIVSYLIFKYKK
ncbi:hypothetical protein [Spirosoma rigui]|uniref:hypothetical protein n=1 Tax=Spirosoma rigui TaxID=564064 RepID=UPI0012D361BF|nr:hypothetical protein [Spirosoma rigui]